MFDVDDSIIGDRDCEIVAQATARRADDIGNCPQISHSQRRLAASGNREMGDPTANRG
jgi:hypothetical protein